MKIGLVSTLVVVSCLFASEKALAAPIAYQIDRVIGAGTVTGTVTTDGSLGALNTSDVLAWELLLDDGSSTTTIRDTDAGAVTRLEGGLLSATATDLLFNFDGSGGAALFQRNFGTGNTFWCLQSDSNSGSSAPPFFCSFTPDSESVSVNLANLQEAGRSGELGVGTTTISVPEPGTIGLLALGLLGLAFAQRKAA